MSLFRTVSSVGRQGQRRLVGALFSKPSLLRLHDAAAPSAQVARFDLGSVMVGEVRSTGHDVEVAEVASASLVVPVAGRLTSEVGGQTFVAEEGAALLFSPNLRQTRVEPAAGGQFLGVPITFAQDDLRAAAERLCLDVPPKARFSAYAMRLDGARVPEAVELCCVVRALYGEIGRGSPRLARAEARASWERLLLEKIVEAMAAGGFLRLRETASGGREQRVRRALEIMHAQYAAIVTVADVAAACGVSLRSLESDLRAVAGISPRAALTAIRLDAARRMLAGGSGGGRVTEAALGCGFGHLGRFSEAYQRRFGELPSAFARRQLPPPRSLSAAARRTGG
jgi:AraC-like DNA-binding protein